MFKSSMFDIVDFLYALEQIVQRIPFMRRVRPRVKSVGSRKNHLQHQHGSYNNEDSGPLISVSISLSLYLCLVYVQTKPCVAFVPGVYVPWVKNLLKEDLPKRDLATCTCYTHEAFSAGVGAAAPGPRPGAR